MTTRNFNTLSKVIIHCSDTRINQSFSVDACRKCHVEENRWSDIGYHYYIELDGTLHKGRNLEYVGSHCYGHNSSSIGICLEGGKNSDDTPWSKPLQAQLYSIKMLIGFLKTTFPRLTIHGHYEFSDKTCPNFDVNTL
tara:strand:+ start:1705 stop:2118 length:414 start_codon:yes stop_codon:yes gene_type:complete